MRNREGCGCSRSNGRQTLGNYRRTEGESRKYLCGCSDNTARQDRPYRTEGGCGCERRTDVPIRRNCAECDALMRRLQKLDFSIQETVLYLDAYPDCCEAKAYYHQLVKERCEVAKEYEEKCGPLNAMGNVSTTSWDWVDAPWPWHPDFPGNNKV